VAFRTELQEFGVAGAMWCRLYLLCVRRLHEVRRRDTACCKLRRSAHGVRVYVMDGDDSIARHDDVLSITTITLTTASPYRIRLPMPPDATLPPHQSPNRRRGEVTITAHPLPGQTRVAIKQAASKHASIRPSQPRPPHAHEAKLTLTPNNSPASPTRA
jgi:hypothetical protein